MHKGITKKIIEILLTYFAIVLLGGCQTNEKNTTEKTSDKVEQNIKEEKSEIDILKEKANENFDKENYKEAKKIYEEIIKNDNQNKNLYLEVINKFKNKNRFDDAYEIVSIAIDNKIDIESMQEIADIIKSNFEVTEFKFVIKQGDSFVLPTEGLITVSGENINVPICWEENNIDTNIIGNYVYIGTNEQYGKTFKLNLQVEYKELTEAEIRLITIKAKNILNSIIDCLAFDESTIIEDGGRTFAVSNEYTTKQQVFNALYDYYTDDAIYTFLDNYTLEKDGVFYIIYGQGGIGLSVEEDDLYTEQTETTLKAVYTKTISDNLTVTQEYEFIKYDNCWIRSDITLYP